MENLRAMKNSNKVVVIGLDGATFDLMKPWVDEKRLPTIGNLMEKGVWGQLRSVIPPISAPAWVSFMTGKNPGKHGVFDFVTYPDSDEGQPQLVSSLSFKDRTLWENLSLHGIRVGVVNVPMTYPPKKVNGFLISCFMTPPSAKVFTFPEDLRKEIPDYRIDLDFVKDWLFEDETAGEKVKILGMVRDQYDVTEKRTSAVLKLVDKWKPDFLIVVFKGTDNLQHYFWEKKEVLLKYYQKLDEIIQQILDRNGKEINTFIISDHGFGPAAIKNFFINTWLEQQGLLKRKGGYKARLFGTLFSIALKIASKVDQFIRLRSILPQESVNRVIKSFRSEIDWNNTKAYGDDKYVKGIKVNLKGREPSGIVEKEEYEQLREEIIDKLKALKDPETGENVVRQVYKKEELYSGRFLDRISDIVILLNHKYTSSTLISDVLVKARFKSSRDGDHMNGYIDGILIANGPDIEEGKQIVGAELIDIAPTILHMMNVSIPTDMDGKVLKEIFRESSEITRRPTKYQSPIDESEIVRTRIKDLKALRRI